MLLRVGATLSLVASACAQAGMLLAEVANLDLPHISAKAHACAWMLFFSELRQHGTALGVVDRLSYAKPHSPNAAPCCDRLRRSIVPRRFYAGKAL